MRKSWPLATCVHAQQVVQTDKQTDVQTLKSVDSGNLWIMQLKSTTLQSAERAYLSLRVSLPDCFGSCEWGSPRSNENIRNVAWRNKDSEWTQGILQTSTHHHTVTSWHTSHWIEMYAHSAQEQSQQLTTHHNRKHIFSHNYWYTLQSTCAVQLTLSLSIWYKNVHVNGYFKKASSWVNWPLVTLGLFLY